MTMFIYFKNQMTVICTIVLKGNGFGIKKLITFSIISVLLVLNTTTELSHDNNFTPKCHSKAVLMPYVIVIPWVVRLYVEIIHEL